MLEIHRLKWSDCLSHQIWPYIEKGWKDEDKKIHFFWGLGGANVPEIREVERLGEEWWYVDVGYLTKQITRYPIPAIHEKDLTYFRIIKGGIHTKGLATGGYTIATDETRLKDLIKKGIDVDFRGWQNNDGHILLCPSSPTVTMWVNKMSQDDWCKKMNEILLEYTDRPIKFRNKPRPGNQWWETDITDDLEGAYALVTNMSLSAIDAIKFGIPAFTHKDNVTSQITSQDISKIEKPYKPSIETIFNWLRFVAEHQFTLTEIGSGLAYETLNKHYENKIL